MRSAIITILCAGCLASVSFIDVMAQREGSPGYIITTSLDTLYGNIISAGNDLCRFDDGNQIIDRKPGEIFGFRFSEGKFYVTKTITINSFDRTFFLEYLLNGIASVYYIRYQGIDHYYFEKDGMLHELTNEVKEIEREGAVMVFNSNRFKGILISLLSDCPEIIPEIEKSTFSRQSMVDVSRKYHEYVCNEYECIIYEKEFNKTTVSFGPVFSAGYSSYRIMTLPHFFSLEYLKYHSGPSHFTVGAGINLKIDLGTKKLKTFFYLTSMLEAERFYMRDYVDYGSEVRLQVLDSKPFMLSNTITFNFGPHNRRINPYIGVGYGFDDFSDKNDTFNYYRVNGEELVFLNAYAPRFLTAVHSAVITGGGQLAVGRKSYIGADFTLKRRYGYSYGIRIVSGWGLNTAIRYFF